MTIKLLINSNDDPQFVELVTQIISGLIRDSSPREVFVMKIDNWFDHKWLTFSGIGWVRLDDFRLDLNTALDEFRRGNVTFPPSTPTRVIAVCYFLRGGDGAYAP